MRPRRGNIGFFIFLMGVVVAIGIVGGMPEKISTYKPKPPVSKVNTCTELMPMTGKVMASWVKLGVISDDSPADKIYVREKRWKDAGNGGRVSMAMAAFCIKNMGGTGMLRVISHETNETLATVSDGNYFD